MGPFVDDSDSPTWVLLVRLTYKNGHIIEDFYESEIYEATLLFKRDWYMKNIVIALLEMDDEHGNVDAIHKIDGQRFFGHTHGSVGTHRYIWTDNGSRLSDAELESAFLRLDWFPTPTWHHSRMTHREAQKISSQVLFSGTSTSIN